MQHLCELTDQMVTIMPNDDAFGAFLTNYKPLVEDTAFLEKYLIDMGIKSPGIEKHTSHESQIYLEALERHFNRLSNFLISGQDSVVNLVFGNVGVFINYTN